MPPRRRGVTAASRVFAGVGNDEEAEVRSVVGRARDGLGIITRPLPISAGMHIFILLSFFLVAAWASALGACLSEQLTRTRTKEYSPARACVRLCDGMRDGEYCTCCGENGHGRVCVTRAMHCVPIGPARTTSTTSTTSTCHFTFAALPPAGSHSHRCCCIFAPLFHFFRLDEIAPRRHRAFQCTMHNRAVVPQAVDTAAIRRKFA